MHPARGPQWKGSKVSKEGVQELITKCLNISEAARQFGRIILHAEVVQSILSPPCRISVFWWGFRPPKAVSSHISRVTAFGQHRGETQKDRKSVLSAQKPVAVSCCTRLTLVCPRALNVSATAHQILLKPLFLPVREVRSSMPNCDPHRGDQSFRLPLPLYNLVMGLPFGARYLSTR
jgi:hypothetical protein